MLARRSMAYLLGEDSGKVRSIYSLLRKWPVDRRLPSSAATMLGQKIGPGNQTSPVAWIEQGWRKAIPCDGVGPGGCSASLRGLTRGNVGAWGGPVRGRRLSCRAGMARSGEHGSVGAVAASVTHTGQQLSLSSMSGCVCSAVGPLHHCQHDVQKAC